MPLNWGEDASVDFDKIGSYVDDSPAIDAVAARRARMAFLVASDGHQDSRRSFQELREVLFVARKYLLVQKQRDQES
jgi:hypothetical protein